MKHFVSLHDPEIAQILTSGGIGVLRTDTLYGVVASASNEAAVQRVYELKGRDDHKSPIVLVNAEQQLYDEIPEIAQPIIRDVWPGPVSVIIPAVNAPAWLSRGNKSVAYRQPNNHDLRALLATTGPLIAPSANPQGEQPAMNIKEAVAYFGDKVDFYVDGGEVTNPQPSQLLQIGASGEVTRLR